MIRLCLSLGVTPVFAPPRETGFQANIERYNGLWQKSVWERFHFKNYKQLMEPSQRYVEAFHDKKYDSIQSAPDRYEVPKDFVFSCNNPPSNLTEGKIILLKRTDNNGYTNVLGNSWEVDNLWTNRLTRVEIILEKKSSSFTD